MTAQQQTLSPGAPSARPSTQVGGSATTLITEHEVAFSTAAAVPVRPAKTRPRAVPTAGVVAALHRMVSKLTSEERGPQRYYSNHYDFVEQAAMAREMYRL
jgi:hypothetical protein